MKHYSEAHGIWEDSNPLWIFLGNNFHASKNQGGSREVNQKRKSNCYGLRWFKQMVVLA